MKRLAIFLFIITSITTAKGIGYSGGNGDPNNPYQIATAQDLIDLGETPDDYGKSFILMADIDLDPNLPGGKVFDQAVIAWDVNDSNSGFEGTSFSGVFDGNNCTIRNLNISVGTHYLGLFGCLDTKASIFHLGLENVSIQGTGDNVGGLAGRSDGIVMNCYSTGTVAGTDLVGGIVGYTNHGGLIHSYSTADVSGNDKIGGLVGHNTFTTLSNCYSSGAVTGNTYIGGLVGDTANSNLCNCYCTGTVSGHGQTGGLAGYNWFGSFVNCYSRGTVLHTGSNYIGGFLGQNHNGRVESSYWDISVSGVTDSDGGKGRSTAQMKKINTYLNSGWDFVDEVSNGTSSIWQMTSSEDFPILVPFGEAPYPMLSGNGSPSEPYIIHDVFELSAVNDNPGACYQLGADIDLSNVVWNTAVIPIFYGTFDGNGFTINNLTIKGAGHLALFGQLSQDAQINNLGLIDTHIEGKAQHVGGFIGDFQGGTLQNCYITGTVTGTLRTGGLCGKLGNSHILRSYNAAEVKGGWGTGGITGAIINSHISDCYNIGPVTGDNRTGGLVGRCNINIVISNCYSTGFIIGRILTGGLTGKNKYESAIVNSFWDVDTSGQLDNVGGVGGMNTTQMQDPSTFLDVGWDFVDETDNGTDDIWWILEGQDYPRLWWEIDTP